jgi:hypothetical protein
MTTKTILLATDFSPCPAGRYVEDGPFSGAAFRDQHLLPAIKTHDKVIVDMDGAELAGSSFLEEAFGGLIRAGFSESELKMKLEFRSSRLTDATRIWRYIHDEAIRSNNRR